MSVFRLLAALVATFGCAACSDTEARTWKQVYPREGQQGPTIAGEGVVVTVTPPVYDEEAEDAAQSFRDSYEDATIEVRFPGLPPYRVPPDRYRSSPYGISVGIGRMSSHDDAAPTVLIAGYSGGAHCCATLQAVSLVDGAPVSAILPMKDGEPVGRFPRDLDRDGTVDIEWMDDSLRYAFSSGAASWSVPRIYHIVRGEPVDVSRAPGFAQIYRKLAADTLKECRSDESERNGACAAYAYAGAIQGDPEAGIRTAVALATSSDWYPYDCLAAEVDGACPEGELRQFAGFEDALRWIMRRNGYLE